MSGLLGRGVEGGEPGADECACGSRESERNRGSRHGEDEPRREECPEGRGERDEKSHRDGEQARGTCGQPERAERDREEGWEGDRCGEKTGSVAERFAVEQRLDGERLELEAGQRLAPSPGVRVEVTGALELRAEKDELPFRETRAPLESFARTVE
jgi:hypothetical protein